MAGTRPAPPGRSGTPTAAPRRWCRARSPSCCSCRTVGCPAARWRPVAVAAHSVARPLLVARLVPGRRTGRRARHRLAGRPRQPARRAAGVTGGRRSTTLAPGCSRLPLLLGVAAVAVRLSRRDADQRGRLVGVLAAAAVFALLVVLGRALWPAAADLLDVAGSALLAAALTSAVLRRRVHGVDVVVHHAFVYAVLTGLIGLGYVGRGGRGRRARRGPAGVRRRAWSPRRSRCACCRCAVTCSGCSTARCTARATTSARRSAGSADSVGHATTLDDVTAGLARATAASLRATYVGVEVGRHPRQRWARPTSRSRCGCRWSPATGGSARSPSACPAGRRWRRRDRDLLVELADHGGRAVHAVQLADALLTNRQLLVTAREEERSRLRRDLHDELGPTLAGLAMQLGGLQELLRQRPGHGRRAAGPPGDRRPARARRRTPAEPRAATAVPGRAGARGRDRSGRGGGRAEPGGSTTRRRTCPPRSRWRRTGSRWRRCSTWPGTPAYVGRRSSSTAADGDAAGSGSPTPGRGHRATRRPGSACSRCASGPRSSAGPSTVHRHRPRHPRRGAAAGPRRRLEQRGRPTGDRRGARRRPPDVPRGTAVHPRASRDRRGRRGRRRPRGARPGGHDRPGRRGDGPGDAGARRARGDRAAGRLRCPGAGAGADPVGGGRQRPRRAAGRRRPATWSRASPPTRWSAR